MPTSVTSMLRSMKDQPAFVAFILTAVLIVALCLAFNPRFETNDDVEMSMVAHGYGLAAYGSPHLVFSNVLWGYLVRAIPAINSVLGYSLATLATLLVAGWATLYYLLRLGAGHLTGLLAVALLIARPTLFPQFTINAGLLTVAAIIGWQVYARLGGIGNLVVACLLALSGFLIRYVEFLLVLGVALPLLPWHALRNRRQMQIAFLLLGMASVSAAAFDHWSYSGPEWRPFLETRQATNSFVNFGMDRHLKQHPEILARHGYSQNDIDLISSWFFVDPQITDPKSLNAMQAEAGPTYTQGGSARSGFKALKALTNLVLLPLVLSAILLLVLVPRWSVALAWVLCLAALFAIGVMGRPGQLRIYVPLMSLLLVAPLVVGKCKEGIRQWVVALTLFAACVGNAYLLIPQALAYKQQIQQVQKDLHDLPAGPIVNWGSSFPYESAFPVLANDLNARAIRFDIFDAFTQAPFSVTNAEQMAGSGMLTRLRTAAGITLIATPTEVERLSIYCRERLNGQLHGKLTHQTIGFTVWQVRCE